MWWVHLLGLLWLGVGTAGCWSVHRQVSGAVRRSVGFAFWVALCFLPVAWFEGRWLHWWWIQPRIGEPLASVASRLGVADQADNGEWMIPYSAPLYWVIPSGGLIRITTDSDARVESWDATWR